MEFDVVVVGSGISGSVTAYYLAKHGFSVAVLNKNSRIEECNTYYAQGGIVYKGKGDSPELLKKDIMRAGADICNPDALDIIAEEGPEKVKQVLINDFQVSFTLDKNQDLDFTEEGAHSAKRIIHSQDTTGRSIEESAIKALQSQSNITILTNYTVVDVISWDHHALDRFRMYKPPTSLGVYALNNKSHIVETIKSKIVVLATGGIGQVYLHSTNPPTATGDGIAMGFRAGARLINMEYTQFHPTTMYHPKANNFLISEAVRGEGGILRTRRGEAFMKKYHELRDLAPRDIVTRSILMEMLEYGDKFVYLDLSAVKEDVTKRFPYIYHTCKDLGIDISQEPIPVVPAFHFSCGGIQTDMNGGTTVKRLFAVGEVACTGVHGANRLASTSLLEGVVFGKRIADYIYKNRDSVMDYEFPEIPDWVETGVVDEIDPALINQDWNTLQNIMWNYVGAIRSKKRLRRAISDLKNLRNEIEDFYQDTRMNRKIIELRNAVQTGLSVLYQAWSNRDSIGAHYRID